MYIFECCKSGNLDFLIDSLEKLLTTLSIIRSYMILLMILDHVLNIFLAFLRSIYKLLHIFIQYMKIIINTNNIILSLYLSDIHHSLYNNKSFASCNKYNGYKSSVIRDLKHSYDIDIASSKVWIICDTIDID